MRVGILALQGAVAPHQAKLNSLGVEAVEVRRAHDLENIAGIILPGGESTTMLHLLKLNDLYDPLKEFVAERQTWGVCAGTILLATRVTGPEQPSFGSMDIDVARNAFGRQVDSFIAPLESDISRFQGVEGVFIRAPRIRRLGPKVKSLITWKNEPVMVEEANLLATTFHPELTEGFRLHQYFLDKCTEDSCKRKNS